jgi:hypothetical protein
VRFTGEEEAACWGFGSRPSDESSLKKPLLLLSTAIRKLRKTDVEVGLVSH